MKLLREIVRRILLENEQRSPAMGLYREMLGQKSRWRHIGPCSNIEDCDEAYFEYTAKDPNCKYFVKVGIKEDQRGMYIYELTADSAEYDPNCEGKGYATECLEWLQEYAGLYDAYLELDPEAYDRHTGGDQLEERPDTDALIAWYEKLGFEFSPFGGSMTYNNYG